MTTDYSSHYLIDTSPPVPPLLTLLSSLKLPNNSVLNPPFQTDCQQLKPFFRMENLDPINIVRLDGIHSPNLTLPASLNHTYTEYPSTLFDTDTIVDRIKDADVVITTTIPLSAQTIERCPKLKHIAVFAIGISPHFPPPICPSLPHIFYVYSHPEI